MEGVRRRGGVRLNRGRRSDQVEVGLMLDGRLTTSGCVRRSGMRTSHRSRACASRETSPTANRLTNPGTCTNGSNDNGFILTAFKIRQGDDEVNN